MADDNRIRLKVKQEPVPISLEDQVDLKAEIKVDVETHLTGLGMVGVIAIMLGALSLIAGSATFYYAVENDLWYGDVDDRTHYNYILAVAELLGAGFVLLMLGTAMFFFGRTVLGSGGLQQFESAERIGGA